MARDLPPGFKLRKGLDGLMLGLSIVFVVRIQMFFSRLIDWRLVPTWTYQPFKNFIGAINQGLRAMMESASSPVDTGGLVGAGSSGGTGGTGAAAGSSGSAIDPALVSTFIKGIGFPVAIFDALDAALIEQLLIIVGFWIAFLVPLWFWGLRPLMFWWRSEDVFEVANPE